MASKEKAMKMSCLLCCMLLLAVFGACRKAGAQPDGRKTYLEKMINSTGTTSFAYDEQNRMISQTFIGADGSPASRTTLTYSEFNDAGLPTQSTAVTENTITGTAVYEYDAQNRIVKTVHSEGSLSSGIASTTRYVYNTNAVEVSNYGPNEMFWGRVLYQLNAQGNVSGYEIYTEENVLRQRVSSATYDDKKSLQEFYRRSPFLTASFFTLSANNVTDWTSTLLTTAGNTIHYSYSYEYNTDGYATKRTLKDLSNSGVVITSVTFEYVKR